MIRTITRVCLATAAVLLLAAPTKAANLRRAQAVATEGKSRSVWVGGGNENKGGSDKAFFCSVVPLHGPSQPGAKRP
jgi:hypothetical protein